MDTNGLMEILNLMQWSLMKGCYTGSQTCHWIFYYNGDIPGASWADRGGGGQRKGEKTETDWLLLSKDLHFSHEGSTGEADSHKLVAPSHPNPCPPSIHPLKSIGGPSRLPVA